ncbi:transaldolase [Kaistia nematophila]|uniref:Transaldolase n=1 Tax=Kaistia nematophila TaxID=2994654 RepID=A0A9X3E4M9_9HYPH|nr:transaldolase [Kaistia nematophila]MBN9027098.1 transaldolase [Hyphomicrobiales bacterium]MCX5571635.1 transaldolase [Kaistia nematophila]
MTSKLDQLKAMTVVVADTGDLEAIKTYRPVDCTTNPSLVLKAAELPAYQDVIENAISWGRKQGGTKDAVAAHVADRLAVAFGAEMSKLVPGRISTEVDADLSFDTEASVKRARDIIATYETMGVPREKILVKLASTWEGIRAAAILQKEGIDCNLTLLFSLAQAVACADAGVFLISPFVGRILDWHVKASGKTFEPEEDPGVLSVRQIYSYYKQHGISTVVMGASFRSTGEIEALAGCDRLTIAPALLEKLAADNGTLVRKLDPSNTGEKIATVAADEKSFRWAMNEDQMATEKLSEGIRLFAKDLRALRALIAKRLEAGVPA